LIWILTQLDTAQRVRPKLAFEIAAPRACQSISAMLVAIEALDPPLRSAWAACSLRVFDIGYDCGLAPFAFGQGLSAELLARLAAVGATLRFTLDSNPEASPAAPGHCS
jgi:hypothetical protein